MLDINLLRKDLPSAIARLETRKSPQAFLNVEAFQALEAERKALQIRTEELQNQRNTLSKQIGQLKSKGEDASAVMAQVSASKAELESSAARLEQIQTDMQALLLAVPNLPHDSVPLGAGEAGNLEVRKWSPVEGLGGSPAALTFEVKDHVDVGQPLGLDFELGTRLTGSRFTERPAGAPASGAVAVHARRADRRARLHRVLCALHRQRRFTARHRPVAQV
jgi:seryl-tRNA synthetase